MLTEEEIAFLDENGYLPLGQLLSADEVEVINRRIEELMQADRLADLVNKGEVFDIFYKHPRVLAAIGAVLGTQFKLSSLNYRAAKPGKGLQKLHVDWKNTVVNGQYKVCNTIWLLDDFVENNGATRLVPGTHKGSALPDEALADPFEKHPDEILIQAPAGSVFIFNSHVWHGGTTNHTQKDRRSIHSYFCASDQPQQIDQRKYITPETRQRIGVEGQRILDVL